MRISVVVVTYNGSTHIERQVRSIVDQTRPADEILIFDDDSADDTLAIASSALGARGTVQKNPTRLGLLGNVEHGLRAATGDVVVLADQDDIWRPEKLRVVEERFTATPGLGLWFTNADLIDDEGQPLPRKLWETIDFNATQQRRWRADPLRVVLSRTAVTGATCAISRALLTDALPLPELGFHDAWFALVAAVLDYPTLADPGEWISYRIHAHNTHGVPPRSIWGRIGALRWPAPWVLSQWGEALQRYPEAPGRHRLEQAERFHRARLALPDGGARLRAMGSGPLGSHYATAIGGGRALAWDLIAPRLFAERVASDRLSTESLVAPER